MRFYKRDCSQLHRGHTDRPTLTGIEGVHEVPDKIPVESGRMFQAQVATFYRGAPHWAVSSTPTWRNSSQTPQPALPANHPVRRRTPHRPGAAERGRALSMVRSQRGLKSHHDIQDFISRPVSRRSSCRRRMDTAVDSRFLLEPAGVHRAVDRCRSGRVGPVRERLPGRHKTLRADRRIGPDLVVVRARRLSRRWWR